LFFGLFIFACGAVTGTCFAPSPDPATPALTPPYSEPSPIRVPQGMRERLIRRLELTPEQAERVDAILREHFDAVASVNRDMENRLQPIRRELERKMSEALTPDQIEKWRELRNRQRPGPDGRNRPPPESRRNNRAGE